MPRKRQPTASNPAPAGGELPTGMPYTLYFPRGGGHEPADIEYSSPLPRVGDTIEYLDRQLIRHRYVVREVVHTFQDQPGASQEIRLLRAGIPAVYLARTRRRRDDPSGKG
jgi:hypothetical protein